MSKVFVASYNEARRLLEQELERNKYPKDVVIRLGGVKDYLKYPVQINSAEAVWNAIDKRKSKEILINKGLPTLPILPEPTYPCVMKGNIRSKGTSVFLCEDANDFRAYQKLVRDGFYLEPYFNYTSEYRLHCTNKEVFFAVKKYKFDGCNDAFINARNHHNKQDFPKPRRWEEVKQASVEAVKALGLDFGAVDMGYNSNTNPHSFVIHEINSSPELLHNTFFAYVNMLDKLIKERL